MTNWNKILTTVDDSETSIRALQYVGKVTGSTKNPEITLLHIYPEPPPYYYLEGHSLPAYKEEKEALAEKIFKKAVDLLETYHIPQKNISTLCRMTPQGETISDAILDVRKEGDFGTIVVGKRGVSKAEEFLFGSISNAVTRKCDKFAVWVIG
ncbi:MAG: universal stress protein [Desulfobulbaceae bacterium]|nr:universal stress protein [Desulfobulbaceae bacterium]